MTVAVPEGLLCEFRLMAKRRPRERLVWIREVGR